jgi:SecD/SecF fusion protein
LASLGAVLTLPGIAGIVLTMGTAVDANIIYERAKEELRDGKSLDEAVKASWTGVRLLMVRYYCIFGSGPIKVSQLHY